MSHDRARAQADACLAPSQPYNEKRNTVRIQSEASYGIGSLFVMDALHLPYGVRLRSSAGPWARWKLTRTVSCLRTVLRLAVSGEPCGVSGVMLLTADYAFAVHGGVRLLTGPLAERLTLLRACVQLALFRWRRATDYFGPPSDAQVNLQTANQMALHTEAGCEASGTSANESGNLTCAHFPCAVWLGRGG